MPRSAPTPCRYPGCMAVLAKPGYCDAHRALVHRDYGRARRSFDAEVGFYQSANWRRLRANFLRLHPFAGCVLAKSKQFLPKWWTTSSQSRTVVAVLTRQTCSHCVCLVTTARQLRRVGGALLGGRGSKSLRLVGKDALACPNFYACKLN